MLRLLTEIISPQTHFLITRPETEIGQELIYQLRTHPNTEVITGLDGPADVIIHLAGFGSPSLSETLFHTSYLHRLLDNALSHKARFILVIPASKTALQETAVSLVTQFGHNFSLDYRILEIPGSLNIPDAAAEIIHSFLPHFKIKTSPAPKSSPKPSKLIFLPLLLLIPWLFLLITTPLLYLSFQCSLAGVGRGKFSSVSRCAAISRALVRIVRLQTQTSLGSGYVFTALGLPPAPTFDSLIKLSDSLDVASQIGNHLLNKSFDPAEITTLTSRLNENLAFFLTSSQSVPKLIPLSQQVSVARSSLLRVQPVLADLPLLISQNQKTNLLLLLQDNTELRPSGGFLSHFAVASLENGRLSDFRFYDTFSTDSQLRGQVDPPADLSRALGESSWYLRDANWSPDFPTAAAKTLWFANKELGLTAETVIALNLDTLVQLLKITGPVKIPSGGPTVSSSNFYSYYLSPPFLTQFYPAFFAKLGNLSSPDYSQTLTLLINALLNRQVFVYRADLPRPSLAYLGWDGGVSLPACRSSLTCLVNYLYPVEANVGINKVNPYISRQSQLNLQFSDTQLKSSYRLTLENKSPQPNWPNGPYKNFIRLLLPIQAVPDQVTVDNTETSFVTTPYQNTAEIGFLATTLPQTTSQINIRWHQPLSLTQRFHYQLDFPNQPGLLPYPGTVNIFYPSSWFASTASAPVLVSAGRLQYNLVISRTNTLDIDFSKP